MKTLSKKDMELIESIIDEKFIFPVVCLCAFLLDLTPSSSLPKLRLHKSDRPDLRMRIDDGSKTIRNFVTIRPSLEMLFYLDASVADRIPSLKEDQSKDLYRLNAQDARGESLETLYILSKKASCFVAGKMGVHLDHCQVSIE